MNKWQSRKKNSKRWGLNLYRNSIRNY